MAAIEAIHSRIEVPKPKPVSVKVWLARFLAAIPSSLRSDPIIDLRVPWSFLHALKVIFLSRRSLRRRENFELLM